MERGYKKNLEFGMEDVSWPDAVAPIEFVGFESKPEAEVEALKEIVSSGSRWVWR